MDNKFQKLSGEKIGDVAEYIRGYLDSANNDVQIFIGTDSQRTRSKKLVIYATVICLYNVGHGAHIIFRKTTRSDVKDNLFMKLWWEVEYSMEVANYLKEKNIMMKDNVAAIHLDLSPNMKNKSNSLYDSAAGYVKNMGFECQAKPDAPVATYAADKICRADGVNLMALASSIVKTEVRDIDIKYMIR